jgi:hypothetical protein
VAVSKAANEQRLKLEKTLESLEQRCTCLSSHVCTTHPKPITLRPPMSTLPPRSPTTLLSFYRPPCAAACPLSSSSHSFQGLKKTVDAIASSIARANKNADDVRKVVHRWAFRVHTIIPCGDVAVYIVCSSE